MGMVGCVNHHYDPTPSETSELSPLLEVISFIVGILNPYGERIGRVETIITHLKLHIIATRMP